MENGGSAEIAVVGNEGIVGVLLIPPNQIDEEPTILQKLRRGERVDHYETVRVRKDGTLLDVSLTVSPVKDLNGTIIGASKIARDITQRKRMESALRMEIGIRERAEAALLEAPPGHRFGNGVQVCHRASDIGRDDCVAYAGQRDFEPRPLLLQFFGLTFQRLVCGEEFALGALARDSNAFGSLQGSGSQQLLFALVRIHQRASNASPASAVRGMLPMGSVGMCIAFLRHSSGQPVS